MKIKQILPKILVGLGLVLFVGTGCKKDATPAPATIADIVNNNASFTTLKAAVEKAGIGSALSSGSLTVFAPDDAAFAAAGITASTLQTLTAAQVADILTYHVLTVKVGSADVPVSDGVVTLQGKKLFASRNANGVFVNGIKVKSADINASNGVVHVIENVLIPPTQTIQQIAAENPNLSLLVAAVSKAGLLNAIGAEGKLTVFAPTNSAFNAAGFNSTADINAASTSLITTVVSYHVLGTNVFASDLINGATATTLQGGTLTIGLTPPSVKITTSANPPSNIVLNGGINIVATNGVVHLINRVLLP
ncbi:fasciclin domain-containing protein [Sediminibacterium sp.]|uniref:fasciclin domain-containing protein n=1 Tax=Sediminibacterium sp. TaxID=1917865 RepID=UPI003F6F229F